MNRKNVFLLCLVLLSALVAFGQYAVDQGVDRGAARANLSNSTALGGAASTTIDAALALNESRSQASDTIRAAAISAHIASTGADVHGLGTISTVNSPVPIANGGTGQTASSAALAALGGANLTYERR